MSPQLRIGIQLPFRITPSPVEGNKFPHPPLISLPTPARAALFRILIFQEIRSGTAMSAGNLPPRLFGLFEILQLFPMRATFLGYELRTTTSPTVEAAYSFLMLGCCRECKIASAITPSPIW